MFCKLFKVRIHFIELLVLLNRVWTPLEFLVIEAFEGRRLLGRIE